MSDLLFVEEVAELVRTKPETVRRAIRRGELAASKPAGRLLIDRAAVTRWMDSAKVAPTEVQPSRPAAAKSLPRRGAASSVRAFMQEQREQQR